MSEPRARMKVPRNSLLRRPAAQALARDGIHDSRNRRLFGARLRPHRVLRGGHRRSAVVDRAADRIAGSGADATFAIARSDAANASRGRSPRPADASVAKPKLMRR